MPIDFVCGQKQKLVRTHTHKHTHTHIEKALKIPIDPNRRSPLQFVFIMEVMPAFADFVDLLLPLLEQRCQGGCRLLLFPTLCSLNLTPTPPYLRLPTSLTTSGAVRDRDNWRRLSGGISCWNQSQRDCAALFMCVSAFSSITNALCDTLRWLGVKIVIRIHNILTESLYKPHFMPGYKKLT